MNKKIKVTFWLLFIMFAALIIYLVYFTVVEAPTAINSPYNLRLTSRESSIKRGNIEDENGVVIAESILEDEGYTRQYNYPRMYCHITGYTDMGKTGVESAYNSELLTLHDETLQKFLYIMTNKVFKKGEFSLTGLNYLLESPYSLNAFASPIGSEPEAAQENPGGFENFDVVVSHGGAEADVEEVSENADEESAEETSEETTESFFEDDSELGSEIKDIYDNIEVSPAPSLDTLYSDGYESENDFFAPLIDGYVLEGNSIVLSVDHRIQEKAYELLNGKNGSIVVSDVNTGMIKAMVSYPDFDPGQVADNWDYLTTDEENTPLLNRASQGLYTPGSIFKIGMAQLLIDTNQADMTFDCSGTNYFGNKTLRCYNETVHGHVGLREAFEQSCNGFFAQAALNLTADRLITQTNNLGYNSDFDFPLEHSVSVFNLTEDSDNSELADTGIGQGKTMVTPLHINMITSAVANGGVMYTPQIASSVKSYSGSVIKEYEPNEMGRVMSEETSAELRELMRAVVTEGTGTPAYSDQISIAGKTGTAENGTDNDHIWFTCFAPYENPKYAVTIMLEYAGKSTKATPIAKELLEYINTLE
ncbi:MAG: penicillin-binding protein 2 [Clostridiales bacterium]|nr:penicillin-binding protein 2 [Clostridiales bacterium]